MAGIQLPVPHMPQTQPSGYKSIYSCDYDAANIAEKRESLQPPRPVDSKKHKPNVFLFRGTYNKPICNMWTSPNNDTSEAPSCDQLTPVTCAMSSFQVQPTDHPNFQRIPTRYGSNKTKLMPAKGIVPVVRNVLVKAADEQSTEGKGLSAITSEPLNMHIMGTKRRLTTPYVLDQHLTEHKAIQDMKARSSASEEHYISQSVQRPSRRKLVNTRQPNFSGSSPLVKIQAKKS